MGVSIDARLARLIAPARRRPPSVSFFPFTPARLLRTIVMGIRSPVQQRPTGQDAEWLWLWL